MKPLPDEQPLSLDISQQDKSITVHFATKSAGGNKFTISADKITTTNVPKDQRVLLKLLSLAVRQLAFKYIQSAQVDKLSKKGTPQRDHYDYVAEIEVALQVINDKHVHLFTDK